jgi:cytochrome b561
VARHAINAAFANNPRSAPVFLPATEEAGMTDVKSPISYDPVMQAVHWATLLAIMTIYGLVWGAHAGIAGQNFQAVMQLHRSLGLTVAGLTMFRLAWRCGTRVPDLPTDLPMVQKIAARATEGLIYLLLLAQPALGLIHTNAQGRRVDFYFLGQLPAIVAPDRGLSRLTHQLHALGGNLLLAVIGLHAGAALFHHFIRQDGVLRAMLPACLHRGSERLRSGFGRGKLPATKIGRSQ